MISNHTSVWFGILPLEPKKVCLEASIADLQTPSCDTLEKHHKYVRETGGAIADRAVTLLRLLQPGPITCRLVIWPLAETIPSAYTIGQIGYIPGLRREKYPPEYAFNGSTIDRMKQLFDHYWKIDLKTKPGTRWLNKAYAELNDEDRLAQIVFGLEQLLLKGEGERGYYSYKMALRAAWLLEREPAKRMMVFEDLRKGYSLRSKIAHGSLSKPLSNEELELTTKIENILRRLILEYLVDSNRFNQESMDKLVLGLDG